jgi:hypothetical protein
MLTVIFDRDLSFEFSIEEWKTRLVSDLVKELVDHKGFPKDKEPSLLRLHLRYNLLLPSRVISEYQEDEGAIELIASFASPEIEFYIRSPRKLWKVQRSSPIFSCQESLEEYITSEVGHNIYDVQPCVSEILKGVDEVTIEAFAGLEEVIESEGKIYLLALNKMTSGQIENLTNVCYGSLEELASFIRSESVAPYSTPGHRGRRSVKVVRLSGLIVQDMNP